MAGPTDRYSPEAGDSAEHGERHHAAQDQDAGAGLTRQVRPKIQYRIPKVRARHKTQRIKKAPVRGKGMFRGEVHKIIMARGWSWMLLAERMERVTGKTSCTNVVYMIRSGTRLATPGKVEEFISTIGALDKRARQRLHVAAALDAGYRIGG